MHPLERYLARHQSRPGSQTPDHDLLLLSIAQDTHEMLLMARENQEYIRIAYDMNNTTQGEQHEQDPASDPDGRSSTD